MRIVYRFRSGRREVLNENSCSEIFGKFSQKYPWWDPVSINLRDENL